MNQNNRKTLMALDLQFKKPKLNQKQAKRHRSNYPSPKTKGNHAKRSPKKNLSKSYKNQNNRQYHSNRFQKDLNSRAMLPGKIHVNPKSQIKERTESNHPIEDKKELRRPKQLSIQHSKPRKTVPAKSRRMQSYSSIHKKKENLSLNKSAKSGSETANQSVVTKYRKRQKSQKFCEVKSESRGSVLLVSRPLRDLIIDKNKVDKQSAGADEGQGAKMASFSRMDKSYLASLSRVGRVSEIELEVSESGVGGRKTFAGRQDGPGGPSSDYVIRKPLFSSFVVNRTQHGEEVDPEFLDVESFATRKTKSKTKVLENNRSPGSSMLSRTGEKKQRTIKKVFSSRQITKASTTQKPETEHQERATVNPPSKSTTKAIITNLNTLNQAASHLSANPKSLNKSRLHNLAKKVQKNKYASSSFSKVLESSKSVKNINRGPSKKRRTNTSSKSKSKHSTRVNSTQAKKKQPKKNLSFNVNTSSKTGGNSSYISQYHLNNQFKRSGVGKQLREEGGSHMKNSHSTHILKANTSSRLARSQLRNGSELMAAKRKASLTRNTPILSTSLEIKKKGFIRNFSVLEADYESIQYKKGHDGGSGSGIVVNQKNYLKKLSAKFIEQKSLPPKESKDSSLGSGNRDHQIKPIDLSISRLTKITEFEKSQNSSQIDSSLPKPSVKASDKKIEIALRDVIKQGIKPKVIKSPETEKTPKAHPNHQIQPKATPGKNLSAFKTKPLTQAINDLSTKLSNNRRSKRAKNMPKSGVKESKAKDFATKSPPRNPFQGSNHNNGGNNPVNGVNNTSQNSTKKTAGNHSHKHSTDIKKISKNRSLRKLISFSTNTPKSVTKKPKVKKSSNVKESSQKRKNDSNLAQIIKDLKKENIVLYSKVRNLKADLKNKENQCAGLERKLQNEYELKAFIVKKNQENSERLLKDKTELTKVVESLLSQVEGLRTENEEVKKKYDLAKLESQRHLEQVKRLSLEAETVDSNQERFSGAALKQENHHKYLQERRSIESDNDENVQMNNSQGFTGASHPHTRLKNPNRISQILQKNLEEIKEEKTAEKLAERREAMEELQNTSSSGTNNQERVSIEIDTFEIPQPKFDQQAIYLHSIQEEESDAEGLTSDYDKTTFLQKSQQSDICRPSGDNLGLSGDPIRTKEHLTSSLNLSKVPRNEPESSSSRPPKDSGFIMEFYNLDLSKEEKVKEKRQRVINENSHKYLNVLKFEYEKKLRSMEVQLESKSAENSATVSRLSKLENEMTSFVQSTKILASKYIQSLTALKLEKELVSELKRKIVFGGKNSVMGALVDQGNLSLGHSQDLRVDASGQISGSIGHLEHRGGGQRQAEMERRAPKTSAYGFKHQVKENGGVAHMEGIGPSNQVRGAPGGGLEAQQENLNLQNSSKKISNVEKNLQDLSEYASKLKQLIEDDEQKGLIGLSNKISHQEARQSREQKIANFEGLYGLSGSEQNSGYGYSSSKAANILFQLAMSHEDDITDLTSLKHSESQKKPQILEMQSRERETIESGVLKSGGPENEDLRLESGGRGCLGGYGDYSMGANAANISSFNSSYETPDMFHNLDCLPQLSTPPEAFNHQNGAQHQKNNSNIKINIQQNLRKDSARQPSLTLSKSESGNFSQSQHSNSQQMCPNTINQGYYQQERGSFNIDRFSSSDPTAVGLLNSTQSETVDSIKKSSYNQIDFENDLLSYCSKSKNSDRHTETTQNRDSYHQDNKRAQELYPVRGDMPLHILTPAQGPPTGITDLQASIDFCDQKKVMINLKALDAIISEAQANKVSVSDVDDEDDEKANYQTNTTFVSQSDPSPVPDNEHE